MNLGHPPIFTKVGGVFHILYTCLSKVVKAYDENHTMVPIYKELILEFQSLCNEEIKIKI